MISRSEAIRFLQGVYQTLSRQIDLSPNNEVVTRTLTDFVAFMRAAFEEDWAGDLPGEPTLAEAVAHLPRLCGLAEVEMEKWWCRRFLADAHLSLRSLECFWYYENYAHLVAAEYSLMAKELRRTAVLLGSGALPLTAILLSEFGPTLSLRCVDRDGEACGLAAQLVEKLGLNSRIEIRAVSISP